MTVLAHDLQELAREYELFFPTLTKETKDGTPCLRIETHEHSIRYVSVDEKGWFLLGDSRHHETFEQLMNSISPGFQAKFASLLIGKLQALAQAS